LLLCAEEILDFVDTKIFKCIKFHAIIVLIPILHRIHVSFSFTVSFASRKKYVGSGLSPDSDARVPKPRRLGGLRTKDLTSEGQKVFLPSRRHHRRFFMLNGNKEFKEFS
jgi:hypothetical protein